MPAGAVAVILLLNGLQIGLPQPAFVAQGRAWVPARSVLVAADCRVEYLAERNCLVVSGHGPTATIRLDSGQVSLGEQSRTLDDPPRQLNGTLYLPAGFFKLIGMGMQWDAESKSLRLQTRRRFPVSVTVRQLKDDPFQYLGRCVRVLGEYAGPPPAGQSDWRLRDRYELMPCVFGETGAAAAAPRLPLGLPCGYRVEVVAIVRMSKAATLYLDLLQIQQPAGLAGLSCVVSTARAGYRPGEPVLIEVELSNHTEHGIELPPTAKVYLSLADSDNRQLWQQALAVPEAVAAGATRFLRYRWAPDRQVATGRYLLELHSNTELWAYQWCFRIEEQASGEGAEE